MTVVAMEGERQLAGGDALVTGVGAANVIEALRDMPRDTPIHNIGYVGSNVIPVGTRCKIGKVRLYHPNVDFTDRAYDLGGNVPCYTAGDFVLSTEISEPCVFDMELAYILALGFENVTAEKIVSDTLSLSEFERTMEDGKKRL